MATKWTAEDMLELGTRHATLEAECKLDEVMDTLVEEPVFEFWPVGLRAVGREQVRRYYEHLIGTFIPTQRGDYELIEEWLTERSLAQEYVIELDGPGGRSRHRVIGILWADGELMGGERIWGDETCLRAMLGPVYDELERID